MEQFTEGESTREEIKNKLRQNFDGKIVRKDLTKKIKEGANVPVYVLEFLLGQYCSSDDETVIEKGVQNVKRILADNFVRPDESQKILSQLRKKGSHTIIDMVTARLDMKKDCFFAEFSNLGVSNVPIDLRRISSHSSLVKALRPCFSSSISICGIWIGVSFRILIGEISFCFFCLERSGFPSMSSIPKLLSPSTS